MFNSPEGSGCGSGASCTAMATESADAAIGLTPTADCARGGIGSPIDGADDISSRDLRLRSASNGDSRGVRDSAYEEVAVRDGGASGLAGAGLPGDDTDGLAAAPLSSSSSGNSLCACTIF